MQTGFNRRTIPWQNTFSANDNCKRAINRCGNLRASTFANSAWNHCLELWEQFAIFQATAGKTSLRTSCWYIRNGKLDTKWRSRKAKSSKEKSRTALHGKHKVISESFKSKLNSDSSDEKEMILKQNLDVLVPKHIGTINFPCHFLEQIQRADWGAIVFGSWVDVISNCCSRLPKTRSCNTSSKTERA